MFSNSMFFSAAAAGGIPGDFVARYLFDGDFTDETGNFNGTNTSSTFVGAGNGPNGTDFGIQTGGSAYVELGAALSAALGTGAGTLSFAVKTLGTTGDSVILASADSASDTNFLAPTIQNTTNKARTIYLGGNTYQSDATITNDVWQHVIIRVDGSSTSYRLNGTNTTTTVTAGSDTGAWFGDVPSVDFTTIGRIRDLSPFGGTAFQIAFLTLYDRSLSDSECAELEAEY